MFVLLLVIRQILENIPHYPELFLILTTKVQNSLVISLHNRNFADRNH